MLNQCKMQSNLPAVSSSSSRGLSSMDRTIHIHLSSCGQTPKFVVVPVAKRMQSLFSLPCIKCGYRTEKVSPTKKRKLSSSSSSWSYFEVYGDAYGCLSTSDDTVCKQALHQAGTSRVLAAWEKIQSWSPRVRAQSEANSRGRPIPMQSSAAGDDHARGQSVAICRIKGSCSPKTRKFIAGGARDFSSSRAISRPSSKKMDTRRQVAVAAITQALTPCLHPQRHGQGELGLHMANFLSAFMTSAQTNETRFCEEMVRRSLEIMLKKTEAAEREVKAIQFWIDDAENQLHAMPSERDIERLKALLDNLLCHPRVENASRFGCGQHLVQDQRDQFLRAVSDLKCNLARMPTVAEIQELQQELEEIEKELSRCWDASREAVNVLRSAIARGEVAWLRNLESGAECLEAMARTVLPLEALYTTNS